MTRTPTRTKTRTLSRRPQEPIGLGATGRTLIRVVIAGYFVAGALGAVPGFDPAGLTGLFLPEPLAGYAGAGTVLTLSLLVLAGLALRPAALLLALTLFFSSFMNVVAQGATPPIGDFWRDLALICALLLTYNDATATGGRSLLRRLPTVRRIRPAADANVTPRRPVSEPRAEEGRKAPLIPLDAVREEKRAEEAKSGRRAAG